MLTRLQKAVIGAGVLGLALLTSYVPWVYTVRANGMHREKSAGYHFIFDPPPPEKEHVAYGIRIDLTRMLVPMVAAVAVVTALVGLIGFGHRTPKAEAGTTPGAKESGGTGAPSGTRTENLAGAQEPSCEPTTHANAGELHDKRAERKNTLAWTLIALGIFLFVALHGVDFFAYPLVSLLGVLTWSVLFGLPTYLCFRFRKRTGAVIVAALFFLAAATDVVARAHAYFVVGPQFEPILRDRAGQHQTSEIAALLASSPKNRTMEVSPTDSGPARQDSPRASANNSGERSSALAAKVEEEPKDAVGYFKRGLAQARNKEYELAIQSYTRAIELDPANAEYLFLCGHAWYQLGRHALALAYYDTAIKISPNNADWYANRALLLSEMKDFTGARKDWDKAGQLAPEWYK